MNAAGAERREAESQAVNGRKVLVAEDSPITHELLKLLLSQRGHEVDIVTDGLQALEALRTRDYDVALLDFHLPQLDGVQVANAFKKDRRGHKLPRLIAITADVEGLLSHADGCESFDNIVPKPLDIYQVGKLVEEQAAIADAQAAATRAPPAAPAQAAAPVAAPGRSAFEGMGLRFLSWPSDLQASRLSARAMQATLGDARFDAILIEQPATVEELSTIWRHKALYVLPVIDLTGSLGARADLDASKLGARDATLVEPLVRRFQDGRARLNRDLLFSEVLSEELLGRVYASGRPLSPTFDPASRSLVSYNVVLDGSVVARESESLCEQGLFKRAFFDRFFLCPLCSSARMHVREECAKCRSADLGEEPYLHHFKCAHQGPESGFRRGDDLICPKCRRELTHFGYDYDRPGTMIVCRACGHSASEPAIGFACLDCGGHADSENCTTRDVYSYELTDQGTGFAEYGHAFLGHARNVLRFAELPMELIVALNGAAKRYNEDKVPFTLVSVSYEKERELTAEHGASQFAQARSLFVENMRAELGRDDMVVRGQGYDFVLLQKIEPQTARAEFDELRNRAQRTVRYDLGARLDAFGPEDFS